MHEASDEGIECSGEQNVRKGSTVDRPPACTEELGGGNQLTKLPEYALCSVEPRLSPNRPTVGVGEHLKVLVPFDH